MGDHEVITCLSVTPHDNNILDVCLHYFGCLRIDKRSDYFDRLSPEDRRLILDRERRIQKVKDDVKQDTTTIPVVSALAESLHEFRGLNLSTRLRPINIPCSELAHQSCDGMSARMVLFKDGEPYEDPRFPQQWPDQKLPLRDLLYNKSPSNPLAEARTNKNDMIQWFHLPANDMGWIEEAISRYYGEDRPNTESLSGPPSQTRELLSREFWRGQQQGGDLDPTHARHMKPRCDIITMNTSIPDESPKKNLVLFMPYMHWDTYRKTSIRSKITKTKEEHHILERQRKENERYDKAKEHFHKKDLKRARPVPPDRNSSSGQTSASSTRKSSIFRLFSRPRSTERDKKPLSRSEHLGVVFIKAAILFEKMEYFYEEASLKLSIYAQAPLHPRRTLHQYRYGTLKMTEKLDKTQVVYRRTAPLTEYLHHPACKEQDRRKCQHAHCEEKTPRFHYCRQCFSDSQKLPRLIMVDQLWLWVLDERTIITSFPRSWGRDPHSVHKRIRSRLKTSLPGEIQSAYDLSLAIVDQCSGVIFERTRVMEKQPPVIDMFQDAIGNISDRQTLAASHFWSNVAEASRVLSSQDKIETTTMYKIFLNVIREGKLLGEIGGILDELHIMLQIQDQQNRVLRGFSKHVARLLSASISRVDGGGDRRASWLGPQSPFQAPRGGLRLGDGMQVDGWGAVDPAKNTMSHVRELTENLEDHIADLTGLEETGRQISSSLERLVDLKLQQAGVIQAQEASEEALKQGRSIMLFTVITIIFLPLSFVTSVFSMSTAATDYRDGLMTFREEFLYMVPTSLAFAVLVLVIALSAAVRGMIIYTLQLPFTWFTLITSLDLVYTKLIPNGHSLTERSKREIRDMKARANLKRHARTEKEEIRRIQVQAIETFGAPARTDTELGGEMKGGEKGVYLEGENLV